MSNQKKCYAHFHMTATEYAIYDVCRALSAPHDGVLYFSGPKIAKRFRSMSKNTPYTALKSLVDMKWFLPLDDPEQRQKDKDAGKHFASRYKVLTHPEWVEKHPNCCPNHSDDWKQTLSSQNEGTLPSPSQSEGMDSPKMRESSIPIRGNAPSQNQGTNLSIQPIKITHISTDTFPLPSQSEGMPPLPSFLDGANHASASLPKGEPFPEIGTVDRAASIIASALGVTADGAVKAWRKTVDCLTSEGYSPQLIADTLHYYVRAYGAMHVRSEGAEGFAVSFRGWLLREATAKDTTA